MGVNGETDQYEINTYMKWTDTRDASFNWLHIPPKMFVDLIKQIDINLTNYNIHTKSINRINTQYDHCNQTSLLTEKLDTISHKEAFYQLIKWSKQMI